MNRIYNIQNQYALTAGALKNQKMLLLRSYKCASQWSSSAGHKTDQKANLQLLLAISIKLEENDLGGETAVGSADPRVRWAHKPISANICAWLHLRSYKMIVNSPNKVEEAVRAIFS